MDEAFLNGRVVLHSGNCLDVLAHLDECSVDSCVTDPPYHLTSIVQRFGAEDAAPPRFKTGAYGGGFKEANGGTGAAFARMSKGFMGKVWDGGDVAFRPETWRAVFRVLKPGAHLVACGGTRTFHRLACAIEDAGFEIRDTLSWIFGSGFPKSHSVGKKLDESQTRCTCDSLRNVRQDGASATVTDQKDDGDVLQLFVQEQNFRGSPAAIRSERLRQETTEQGDKGTAQCGMERWGDVSTSQGQLRERALREMPAGPDLDGPNGRLRDGASFGNGADGEPAIASNGMRPPSRPSAVEQYADQSGTVAVQSQPQECGAWPRCGRCGKPIVPDGLGTALKPAMELVCLARKPLSEGTVAANVLRWGTGAINVDGCRVRIDSADDIHRKNPHTQNMQGPGFAQGGNGAGYSVPTARWPANVAHDGSAEVAAAFPESTTGIGGGASMGFHGDVPRGRMEADADRGYGDTGSAARFFFQAKQDNPCHSIKSASDVEQAFDLRSEHVVSVLSNAVEQPTLQLALHKPSYRAQNTTVSALQLRIVCESVIEAIQRLERRCSLGLEQESITARLGPVICAATRKQTGTTTIILSLWKYARSVEVATFDIIETSAAVGAQGFAKRVWYTAKADADDRLGSKHPTVKPLDLMQWLVRLVTPRNGVVLDPFSGTGTTGEAAWREGTNAVLIEAEPEYQADIRRRMALVLAGPDERTRESIKAKNLPVDYGPLFGFPEAAE